MDDIKKDESVSNPSEGKKEERHEFKPAEHKEFHSHEPHHHGHSSGKGMIDRFRENPWVVSTIVLGVVALILLLSDFSGGATGGMIGVANQDQVTQRVLDFLDTQVPDGGVEYVDTTLENGLYKITVTYQGQNIPVYVTADGESLVQGVTPFNLLEQYGELDNESGVVDVSVDDDPMKGDADAPVTIVEFSDFECPFCEKFYTETYKQLVEEYVDTGKVKIIFRDFPLNSIHPYAEMAAEAAECAYDQGKFWDYHDMLFEEQSALTSTYQSKGIDSVADSLKQYAKEMGLNTVKFNTCLDSGDKASEVANDLSDGQSYGVTGTPAFFINGKLIAGAYPFEDFQQIIEEELANV